MINKKLKKTTKYFFIIEYQGRIPLQKFDNLKAQNIRIVQKRLKI
jgi:hypothetical protein